MNKKELKKLWEIFLINNETTAMAVAEKIGTTPQGLGRKINSGSIRFIELCNIVESYGYEFKLVEKK